MRIFSSLIVLCGALALAACGNDASLPDSAHRNGLTSDEQGADDPSGEADDEDESGAGDPSATEGLPPQAECYDIGDGLRECLFADGDTVCVVIYDEEGEVDGECYSHDDEGEDEGDDDGEHPGEDDADDDSDHPDDDDATDEDDEECPGWGEEDEGDFGDWGDWGDPSGEEDESSDDGAEEPGDDGEGSGEGDDHHDCTETSDGGWACEIPTGVGTSCRVVFDANGHVTEDTCSGAFQQP